jgi:hypothetical protein
MKMSLKIGLLILTMVFSDKLAAQENTQSNNNLLDYYDTELFQLDHNMVGGLTLNFKNRSSRTLFGIAKSMKNNLIQYEDTNRQYRSYRGKTISGNILMWGGMATMLAGVCITAFGQMQSYTVASTSITASGRMQSYTADRNINVGAGLMLGGSVSALIATFILSSGQENIFNAVNLYNRHRIDEYIDRDK